MTKRRSCLVAALATLAAALLVAPAPPATAYPADRVELVGHGWGHGRGMGQYGALGYAIDHGWSYEQILGHYYSNTTMGSLPGGDGGYGISVRVMDRNATDTIVTGPLTVEQWPEVGEVNAALVRRTSGGAWELFTGNTCAGQPWTSRGVKSAGFVRLSPAAGASLTICLSNGTRNVRGTVRADDVDGQQVTVNDLAMGDYLRGVVPRESPASWGSLDRSGDDNAGMHALRAQSVAARSYAAAEDRWPGVAKTCDTISCQVYAGISQTINGSTVSESSNTNQAIAETGGLVRHMSSGAIARTEFSSSTGGWTAGGTFPAVPDAGDTTVSNPNHTWRTSIPVTNIEAKYGKGSLSNIEILARNGLGEDGGRVTSMRLSFSGGGVTISGDKFRQDFGLKSDWFTVSNSGAFPYHVVTRDGGVFSFNGAQFHGSLPGIGVRTPVKDITEGHGGYWILGEDGGVFSFDVDFHGSMGGKRLNSPVVGMEATPTRNGYWLVAADGGIFSFGDASFHGSTGSMALNAPVVGMFPTNTGGGYWMVATDGGIFTFGNAAFKGSTGGMRLNLPVFAMAATPSGNGYWLVARDGGIFTFGDAPFLGSLPGRGVRETAVEMLPSPSGQGYLIVTAEGRVYGFGDAPSAGGPRDVGAGPSPTVGAGAVPTS
ncbi:MAG TPA: SpoIID/LytB domain-containing protein [Acidimicrobiales bacterium]